MQDIVDAIRNLAYKAQDQPSEVRIWTASSLSSSLGLEAILSSSEDPVEAIVEMGDLWVLAVDELLEEQPHRQGEVLRAAHAVVQRLLSVVPQATS